MKQALLVDQICAYLQNEESDLVDVAKILGLQALPAIKKIILSEGPLAAKAITLDKIIRLLHNPEGKEIIVRQQRSKFSAGMRSIATTRPSDHIKGFGSDMLNGK
jgi:hypothetical protein